MPDFLDQITIASPCHADWQAMTGTDQVRFCGDCNMNVYNLSDMSRASAEALVKTHEGRLCVRFYQRPDGTLITQDCPVGVTVLRQKALRRKLPLRQWAAVVTVLTLAGVFTPVKAMAGAPVIPPEMAVQKACNQKTVKPGKVKSVKMGKVRQGDPAVQPPKPMIMGEMVAPPPKSEEATPVPPPPLMGKPAFPPKR
jgi:hypothetical protein